MARARARAAAARQCGARPYQRPGGCLVVVEVRLENGQELWGDLWDENGGGGGGGHDGDGVVSERWGGGGGDPQKDGQGWGKY